MKSRLPMLKIATALFLLLSIIGVGCTQTGTTPNSNNQNSNTAQGEKKAGGTPENAQPMGQTAPGFFRAGPDGPVSLRFSAPADDQTLTDASVAPTFNITGYPIYMDTERNKGQHIHVILDNEPYEADYDPTQPFKPQNGKFDNLKEGTHTLRAFPSREWHESIKEPGGAAFDMIVFHVRSKTPGVTVNKSAPLLTYSRPKGEYRWQDDPRGIMLDFYVTNANLGINDYRVRYSVNGKNPQVLTRWEPVWWKWEELGPGEHTVLLELLDKDNKPVPFMVGGMNYNRTERKFKILAPGEQPSAPAHSGANANSNARNSNTRNSNAGGAGNRNGSR